MASLECPRGTGGGYGAQRHAPRAIKAQHRALPLLALPLIVSPIPLSHFPRIPPLPPSRSPLQRTITPVHPPLSSLSPLPPPSNGVYHVLTTRALAQGVYALVDSQVNPFFLPLYPLPPPTPLSTPLPSPCKLNNGVYHVLAKRALAEGVHALVFCVYRDAIALLALLPAAALTERAGEAVGVQQRLLGCVRRHVLALHSVSGMGWLGDGCEKSSGCRQGEESVWERHAGKEGREKRGVSDLNHESHLGIIISCHPSCSYPSFYSASQGKSSPSSPRPPLRPPLSPPLPSPLPLLSTSPLVSTFSTCNVSLSRGFSLHAHVTLPPLHAHVTLPPLHAHVTLAPLHAHVTLAPLRAMRQMQDILGNQLLFLVGLNLTGPTTAAALQPSIPVFTLLLALLLGLALLTLHNLPTAVHSLNLQQRVPHNSHGTAPRAPESTQSSPRNSLLDRSAPRAVPCSLDSLNLQHWRDQVRLVGLALCVGGAVLMAVFRGPLLLGEGGEQQQGDTALLQQQAALPPGVEGAGGGAGDGGVGGGGEGWVAPGSVGAWSMGVMSLVGNCMSMAAYLTIQVPVLRRFPAPVTVTAMAYAMGALLMLLIALLSSPPSWVITGWPLVAVVFAGVVTSALNYALMTAANRRVGPATVALYNPLQPVASATLAYLCLASPIFLGSVIGGFLVLSGLYLVVWGPKGQELSSTHHHHAPADDAALAAVGTPVGQEEPEAVLLLDMQTEASQGEPTSL
ncbi:unnamed protein product [Closterium sp. NIES-64]|nr:unnamed protein product [Closterium sp. NIES-64]